MQELDLDGDQQLTTDSEFRYLVHYQRYPRDEQEPEAKKSDDIIEQEQKCKQALAELLYTAFEHTESKKAKAKEID